MTISLKNQQSLKATLQAKKIFNNVNIIPASELFLQPVRIFFHIKTNILCI
jgi:hypothetical protein